MWDVVIIVPADSLVVSGAGTTAGTLVTKLMFHIFVYTQVAIKIKLSKVLHNNRGISYVMHIDSNWLIPYHHAVLSLEVLVASHFDQVAGTAFRYLQYYYM